MKEYFVAQARFVTGDVLVFESPEFVTGKSYIASDYRPGCLGEVWTREDAKEIYEAVLTPREQLPAAFLQRHPDV